MKRTKILFITFIFALIVPSLSSAWVIGEPLVPCGQTPPPGFVGPLTPQQSPCSQCELLHLADNLIDFILIAAAPILATFFFILAGLYIMLGGARPDMLATGKRMFTSALIGIIIVMLAWLVTNTLITTLIAPTVSQKLPSGGTFNFDSADWWKLTCTRVGLSDQPPGTGGGGGAPPPPSGCSNPLSTPPVCLDALNAVPSTNTATVNWRTAVNASSTVNYRITGTGSWQTVTGPSGINHSVNITGLTPNTLYDYYVISNGATSITQVFRTLTTASSTCQLQQYLTLAPYKSSYNSGENLQISVLGDKGCVGYQVEVRVGPATATFGYINWNNPPAIILGTPVMGDCVSTSCAVIGWTVTDFNPDTDRYSIRAVAGNGSGGVTESFVSPPNVIFTVNP